MKTVQLGIWFCAMLAGFFCALLMGFVIELCAFLSAIEDE